MRRRGAGLSTDLLPPERERLGSTTRCVSVLHATLRSVAHDFEVDEPNEDDLLCQHVLLVRLLEKVGGSFSIDPEDAIALRGKAIAWRSEGGSVVFYLRECRCAECAPRRRRVTPPG